MPVKNFFIDGSGRDCTFFDPFTLSLPHENGHISDIGEGTIEVQLDCRLWFSPFEIMSSLEG